MKKKTNLITKCLSSFFQDYIKYKYVAKASIFWKHLQKLQQITETRGARNSFIK